MTAVPQAYRLPLPAGSPTSICECSHDWCMHGQSGWTEDAGIGAAATSVMLQEIMLWSTGRFTESQGFTAELLAGTAPRIQLRPRDSSLGKIISGIEIIPAPDRPGMIKSIIIREGAGNTTTLDFADVKINARLEDGLFRKP